MGSPAIKSRPTVLVALRHKGSFLKQYFHQDGQGGLFIPGDPPYALGEQVELELNFLQEQRTFRIKGEVKWKRPRSRLNDNQAGIGVEFLPSERSTRELILDFVQGKEIRFVERADHRFPVSMQISYKTDSTFVTDFTDDISQGGVFIVTANPMPLGTLVPLKMKVPGSLLPLKLKGVVCWHRKKSPEGMGLKFVFETESQKKKVEKLVARMKAQIISEMQGRRSDPPRSVDEA
ncbi:MAG: TIGR02266 family protein [Myxococcota bacterium]